MGQQLSPSRRTGIDSRKYLRAANVTSMGINLHDVLEMDFSEAEFEQLALRAGDILLVEGGNEKTVGCPAFVSAEEVGYCIQNTLIRCRVFESSDVIPAFVYQYLRWSFEEGAFSALAQGTTILHLGQKRANVFDVALPPEPEQRRIVDLVNAIDVYIESLRYEIETTSSGRSALLADFLTHHTGEWNTVDLEEICDLQIGRTPSRDNPAYWTSDLDRPFCTIADMSGRLCTPKREGVTEAAEREGKAKRVPKDSLLMSFKLTIGRVAFAGCDLFPNEAIVAIDPRDDSVSREYLYLFLGSQDLTQGSGQAAKGKTLNRASLNRIKVLVPPVREQHRIVDLIAAIDMKIESLKSQVAAASVLRSGVLSDLLVGKTLLLDAYDAAVAP